MFVSYLATLWLVVTTKTRITATNLRMRKRLAAVLYVYYVFVKKVIGEFQGVARASFFKEIGGHHSK